MVAVAVLGGAEVEGDADARIRLFNASAAVTPCVIFILNARLRSASSSTRSTHSLSTRVISSLLETTFDYGHIFIQRSDSIVQRLLPITLLFVLHRSVEPLILERTQSFLTPKYEREH